MATFPTHNSNRNVTATAPGPVMRGAEAALAPAQQLRKTVSDITEKWRNAHDVMQYTEAKGQYEVAVADIESRAAADPDFKQSGKYQLELQAAKENALGGIDNQMVNAKLMSELNFSSQISGIKIDAAFKMKELKYNQSMVQTNMDALMRKKLSASTPAEAAQYDDEMQDLIRSNLASGVLSVDEARTITEDAQKTSVLYEIYADSSTKEEDSRLLAELRDPSGKYSFLTPDVRLKMVEEAQRRIFQNNQTFKRENEISKNDRFQGIFQKANEGTLTLSDLDVEMKAAQAGDPGALDQKEILSIRSGLQTKIKTDLEAVATSNEVARNYIEFVNNFIDNEMDRQKGREAIAAAYKDGILSAKEAELLNSLKRETEDIAWERGTMKNNLIPFKNAIQAVGDFFRGRQHHSEQEAAMAIKQLLNRSAVGEDPAKVVPEIIKQDRIKTQPDIQTFPEKGQLMVDPVTGVKALVYPDGSIEVQK